MRTRFFALYVATFVYTAFAQERAAPLRIDLKRPVQEISADLHVSSEQFVACFAGVTPAAGGASRS